MPDNFTLCYCEMKDCIYYGAAPEAASKCRCTHPDKRHHLSQLKCPLYRVDWQRQQAAMAPPKPTKRLEQDF